jgi:hypothetical protein
MKTPCEHPAPAKMAYIVLPMNATSATPLARPAGKITLDGRLSTNVVTLRLVSILEMRDPVGLPK